MPKFKVWNDNDLEHVEIFKGDKIQIPAKSYVLMERDDAVAFKGAFLAPVISDGVANPKTFKKIRIELHSADEAPAAKAPEEPICQACKYKASSDRDLAEHVQAMHRESIVVDEQAEKEIEAKKRGRPAKAAG
jgi:hypothetical protein